MHAVMLKCYAYLVSFILSQQQTRQLPMDQALHQPCHWENANVRTPGQEGV